MVIEPKDLAAVGGFALLTVGMGMIYLPLAFVFTGGALLTAGLWSHFNDFESTAGTAGEAGPENPRRDD
jgi:hypothetical protein